MPCKGRPSVNICSIACWNDNKKKPSSGIQVVAEFKQKTVTTDITINGSFKYKN